MENLSPRSRKILKILIERYLHDGQPIGSKTLASDSSIALSPATVRNIMMDLEERGYVVAPHISAGRVPTEQGLRFFIDSLLTLHPLNLEEIQAVQSQLAPLASSEDLVNTASGLLSGITQLMGIVSSPIKQQQLLRVLEFLPLSNQRILVILVLNEQEVQNRIIQTERDYSASELEQAANYLNSLYVGKELIDIRMSLLDLLKLERENLDQLMRTAIDVADRAFDKMGAKNDYVVAGESNLLALVEQQSIQQLSKLFNAFTQKQDILHLLDQSIKASGLQIFIGEEAGDSSFAGYSMVSSSYSVDGKVVGALGVIGPTRMAYQRVIPIVDITAKLLSAALNTHPSVPI